MRSKFLALFLCVLALATMVGCLGGSDDNYTPATGTISGKVLDAASAPVANATVTNGTQTATTLGDGSFTISGVAASARAQLTIAKTGYLTTYAFEPLAAGQTVNANYTIRAIPGGTTAAIAGLTTGPQSAQLGAGQAKIDFPQNGILDANNNPVDSANVVIVHTKPTTAKALDTFPGVFAGLPLDVSGNLTASTIPFETLGYIYVDLGAGNKLDATLGADLTIPLDPGASINDLTIPLWNFDTNDGQWKQVATATRLNAADPFTAKVFHFSWYNLDRPIAASRLEVTVASYTWTYVDMEGEGTDTNKADLTKRIANARVVVTASLATQNSGQSFFGQTTTIDDATWQAVAVTDGQGIARFDIPTGRMVNISVSANDKTTTGYGYELDGATAKSFINMGGFEGHGTFGSRK